MCVSAVESLARSCILTSTTKVSWKCMYVVVTLPFDSWDTWANNQGNATHLLAGDPLSSSSYFANTSLCLKLECLVARQLLTNNHACQQTLLVRNYMFQTGSKPNFILAHCTEWYQSTLCCQSRGTLWGGGCSCESWSWCTSGNSQGMWGNVVFVFKWKHTIHVCTIHAHMTIILFPYGTKSSSR